MFNLEDVVGPKSTYPKVEYLVVRGFSLAKAEALVRALRQLAKYFKQFLLDHESGILVKAEVPGATRKRILPGKWLKEVFYVNDEEYKRASTRRMSPWSCRSRASCLCRKSKAC